MLSKKIRRWSCRLEYCRRESCCTSLQNLKLMAQGLLYPAGFPFSIDLGVIRFRRPSNVWLIDLFAPLQLSGVLSCSSGSLDFVAQLLPDRALHWSDQLRLAPFTCTRSGVGEPVTEASEDLSLLPTEHLISQASLICNRLSGPALNQDRVAGWFLV